MTEIWLTNTLSRQRERFVPEDPQRVRFYVCGPTVYDLAHVGNARPVVVFDLLFRLLRHHYGAAQVTYVRNITDVDDKIITRANETGQSIEAITQGALDAYLEDMAALGVLSPSAQPRATDYIEQMIGMIQRLLELGHAYISETSGDLLFAVRSMPDYGALSARRLEDLQSGARVAVDAGKRDPADFVLWKPAKADEPEDATFPSPWGRGRPGWHIECSAISAALLGETFDIHGGGNDLIFPHHENEIAQSRCVHGTTHMARIWMHNGMLLVEGQKMSKSLGNFITVRALREAQPEAKDPLRAQAWDGESIRTVLMGTHYRQPLDFTASRLQEATARLSGWYRKAAGASDGGAVADEVIAALADDLDTVRALAVLDRLDGATLLASARFLGLLQRDSEAYFQGERTDSAWIEAQIAQRSAARKVGDFAKADHIRAALAAKGITLEDSATGTSWRQNSL